MTTTHTTRSTAPRIGHTHVFLPRKFPRSYFPRNPVGERAGLFKRAVRWLLPWTMRDYPGIERGAVELLAGRATRESVRVYMKQPRTLSRPLAAALREAIRVRVESGLALMAELDAVASRPPRARVGFMRVDPVTGLSGRSDVGKRRKVTKF